MRVGMRRGVQEEAMVHRECVKNGRASVVKDKLIGKAEQNGSAEYVSDSPKSRHRKGDCAKSVR